jgi:hypothetical protein
MSALVLFLLAASKNKPRWRFRYFSHETDPARYARRGTPSFITILCPRPCAFVPTHGHCGVLAG